MKTICVYCGSSMGFDPEHEKTANAFGNYLAKQNLTLIYGAGNVGLMGTLANAVLDNGGQVVGVIPQFLKDWEVAHTGISELIVTKTMHARKEIMADKADAFVALSGGFGTFDELFEIMTWAQLGLHSKPVGLLNIKGFYDPLLTMIDQLVSAGFLKAENRDLLLVGNSIDELFEKLNAYTPQADTGKWIEGNPASVR